MTHPLIAFMGNGGNYHLLRQRKESSCNRGEFVVKFPDSDPFSWAYLEPDCAADENIAILVDLLCGCASQT